MTSIHVFLCECVCVCVCVRMFFSFCGLKWWLLTHLWKTKQDVSTSIWENSQNKKNFFSLPFSFSWEAWTKKKEQITLTNFVSKILKNKHVLFFSFHRSICEVNAGELFGFRYYLWDKRILPNKDKWNISCFCFVFSSHRDKPAYYAGEQLKSILSLY